LLRGATVAAGSDGCCGERLPGVRRANNGSRREHPARCTPPEREVRTAKREAATARRTATAIETAVGALMSLALCVFRPTQRGWSEASAYAITGMASRVSGTKIIDTLAP